MTEHPGNAGRRPQLDARYDTIGAGYATTRREDPCLRERIHAALGDARTVVNVGAGAGSYEPRDRNVIAIEPSDVMAAQRPRDLTPAIRAAADSLPLRNDAVDAAMAILTVHHWDNGQQRGVGELRKWRGHSRRAPTASSLLVFGPHHEGDGEIPSKDVWTT